MKKAAILALVASLAGLSCKAQAAAAPELKTDEQKTFYALGLVVSENLAPFNMTEAELEAVKAGMIDGVLHHDLKVKMEDYGPKIGALAHDRAAAGAAAEKASGTAYLDKAAAEPGAVKVPTGFVIQEMKPGTGPSPKPTDKVKVHYKGTLIDGTVFDSSLDRGEPVVFPLDHVYPCWTQALQMMKVGGKSRLVCPSDLAAGDRGSPPRIKPGATLVFEVELIGIEP